MEKFKAKFTNYLPEIVVSKSDKKNDIGEIVAHEIREGREWLTVRYENGDVSGYKDELFEIINNL